VVSASGENKIGLLLSPLTTRHSPLPWLCTFLFGIGTFLIVLFFFLPVVDSSGLTRLRDRIEEGNRKQTRLDRQMQRQAEKDRLKDKDGPIGPNEEARKKRETERADWDKERERLEDLYEDAHNSALARTCFYTWGMFFGFLILAMGAVGFLSFGPTTSRRVFGCIIITFQIIVIFAAIYANFNLMRAMRPPIGEL